MAGSRKTRADAAVGLDAMMVAREEVVRVARRELERKVRRSSLLLLLKSADDDGTATVLEAMEELEKALAVVTEYAAKTMATAVARKDVMSISMLAMMKSEDAFVYLLPKCYGKANIMVHHRIRRLLHAACCVSPRTSSSSCLRHALLVESSAGRYEDIILAGKKIRFGLLTTRLDSTRSIEIHVWQ